MSVVRWLAGRGGTYLVIGLQVFGIAWVGLFSSLDMYWRGLLVGINSIILWIAVASLIRNSKLTKYRRYLKDDVKEKLK